MALALTRLIIAVSGLAVNVALARWMSRDAFGAYRWVWACVAVAAFGAHLGLWQLVTRRVSRDPAEAPRVLPVALTATAGLSVLTGVAIVAYVWVADGRPEVVAAAALGALTLAANALSQLVQATFHGLRRMFLEIPGVLLGRAVFALSHLVLLALGFGLVPLYAGRAGSAVVMLVALLVMFRWRVGRMAPVPAGAVRAWVAHGPAFGATVFFGAVAAQADILMLEAMASGDEVARYAAPASVLLQLAFVANIVSRGFFPQVAALGAQDGALPHALRLQARMLLLVSVPVAVGGMAVGAPLVVFIFGPRYADAVGPFLWLLAAVPIRFLNNGYGMTLTALDRQGVRARIDMVGAFVNVGANLVAIPLLGATGAAMTTLLTDVVVHLWLRWQLHRDVPDYREVGPWLRTLVPALAMAAAVWAMPGHVLVRVAVGGAVYVVLAWGSGGWRRADLDRMLRV